MLPLRQYCLLFSVIVYVHGGFLSNLIHFSNSHEFDGRSNNVIIRQNDPPPIEDAARMARYIVHHSEWGTVSHVSHQKGSEGYPIARVFSISDGPLGTSSGTPYIYTSLIDEGTRDLKQDPRCSMTMTLAEGDYCNKIKRDPEDPRCPQVILIGDFVFLNNGSVEWNAAQNALFTRHPAMEKWPDSHHFRFCKLKIESIILVDNVGGNKYPTVEDYYNSPPSLKIKGKIDSKSDIVFEVLMV